MSHIADDNIMLLKLAAEGDGEAQAKIIENNVGLVWSIVKKFYNRGYEPEELFQVGSIGLLRAIHKFNFDYDVKFSTYAVPMIIGEIKRFLRDDGIIKISRSIKETSTKARVAKEMLSKEFGRDPTIGEIAQKLEITPEELAVAWDAGMMPESLQATVYEGDGNSIVLMDKINNQCTQESDVVNKIVLNQVLESLEPEEKRIIILRFFRELTQSQIAKMLGTSQVQISRIEKKIIKQIQQNIGID